MTTIDETPKPIRSENVPVSAKMLYEMEDRLDYKVDRAKEELRVEIHGVKKELKADIHEVRNELKAEIHEVKQEILGIRQELHEVKAEVYGVKAEVHRVGLLVEEQNARNKFVLDGYTMLYDLVSEINQKLDKRA